MYRRIIILRILNAASTANVDVDEALGGRDPYWWILRQNHTEDITDWIMQICADLLKRMGQQQKRQEHETVRIAREYIDKNLTSIELGLEKVSEVVRLSPAYFSQVFKRDMDMGVNAYITMQRIARAKKLLLSTQLKNDEIARQSGFHSPSYFCQVFKKCEGITAGEYRKRNGQSRS